MSKMKAVSDATPLIHLAKIGELKLLQKIFQHIIIPQEVYVEVVERGQAMGKPEVKAIKDLADSGFIITHSLAEAISLPSLHQGEQKAIALCKKLKIATLLIDEKEGYEAAKILGLHPMRTTAILIRLLNKREITSKEYQQAILGLSESGYFLTAQVYQELIDIGRQLATKYRELR